MITLRAKSLLVVTLFVLSISGIAVAQHDVAGGSTSDTATAGDSSRATTRVRRTPRPSSSARPRAAIRRGLTAEQYNLQGDTFFDAEQYDDALETYTKAVQLKPIASAYYHIGWIYNDRDDYDQAVTALQQSIRLDSTSARTFDEIGYSFRSLKRYDEAFAAYRRAVTVDSTSAGFTTNSSNTLRPFSRSIGRLR